MTTHEAPPTAAVGVIIARFQTPELHRAHCELIEEVQRRHRRVLILLGVTSVRMSQQNPLDFWARERMVKTAYPAVAVQALKDQPTDEGWSRLVDEKIDSVTNGERVLLYGSRDSFIPRYHGRYPVQELPKSHKVTATELRNAARKDVRSEPAYRVGMIYAAFNRYATSFQTVDVLIWRRARTDGDGVSGPATGGIELLLARKHADRANHWRFIGGFVSPDDPSLEAAAKREAREEAGGLTLGDPVYLFSQRVDDWRYRREDDGICTAVFAVPYLWGAPQAQDDVDAVQWFPLDSLPPLVDEHAKLWANAYGGLQRVAYVG